jgi:hypothetical protein
MWRAAWRIPLVVALALVCALSGPLRAQAPTQTPAQSPAAGTSTAPPAGWAPVQPTPPPLKGSQVDPPSNTTTIARPTPESRTSGQVTFTAHLTDESPPLDKGLVWRIFRDKPGPDGKMRLLSTHRDASPQLRLEVGSYMINAAYGRANLTRKVTVVAGRAAPEKFVISVGALRVSAVLASGEAVAENAAVFTILSDERDQFGNRIPVMVGAKPGMVVRLNAGIYQVQSVYGDANAIVRGEVTIEPGKITDATLTHSAARITFRLVQRVGGEALADTQWIITGSNGETIKDSTGAIPTHTLAPGSYVASARRQGLTFKRDFSVQSGDNVYVEVVAGP